MAMTRRWQNSCYRLWSLEKLRERQSEGIALAKKRGVYKGRKKALTDEQVTDMKRRIAEGEAKSLVAREFSVSRETLYKYLRAEP